MTGTAKTPEAEGRVADAPRDNWVDLYAPAAWRPYLRLSRADRPIGTWLLLLPCWWGVALAAAMDQPSLWDLWIALGCAIGAFVMRGAGCTWNDITDRHFDAQVARTRSRPIPSGQVSVKQALVWMVVQALVGLLVLLTFPPLAIALGVGSLGLVAIYPFAKRFTWWPQLFLGLAFNWGALLAFAAHNNTLGWPALLAWVAGIFWTLFYDTIYAHQDKEDDALIGVRSTARLFAENTRAWLLGFQIAAVLLLTAACLVALPGAGAGWGAVLLAMAGVWAFAAHLSWQLGKLDIEDTALCLRLFKSNRDAGLLVALFLAGAALVALIPG